MQVIETVRAMQSYSEGARLRQETIGFVPTMGALHEGHAQLIEVARRQCQRVVVSIFVNPTQFGPKEDYERYPRTPKEDRQLLEKLGVDVLFFPSVEEMYPTRERWVWVEVEELTRYHCGASRPGHFRGVATVVAKLFHAVKPHRAYFGEKDYQQLKVIERMVKELLWDLEIVPVFTVRDADGLALSSRNRYLTPEERERAKGIYRAMQYVKERFQQGVRNPEKLRALFVAEIKKIPGLKLDYAAVVDPHTLIPLEADEVREARLLCAVYVGTTRLIDNLPLVKLKEES